jgi:glycine dehydrogenase subunit 1
MKFIPNTSLKKTMLKESGVSTIDDLFSDIPQKIQIKNLHLPKGKSQQEVEHHLRSIGKKNISWCEKPSFLGGGIKAHYLPAAVKTITSRPEFYTAYTPYQPEASQGFLQAMFEYQSMIAALTGMDIANASLYDGATALAEAALMCSRINKKTTFLVPKNISWDKRCVLQNYLKGPGIALKEFSYDHQTGKVDVTALQNLIDDTTAGVYVENPNFFGIFEDQLADINTITQQHQSLFVIGVDPLSLGIAKGPGDYGADIVIGEGRCLGNPMDFGGSSLGIFACKHEFLRHLPGRIIGLTKDHEGNQAFCMTMQTREQHIRRGKATSNICTNEGLNALTAAVYLSWLGGEGLEALSQQNFEKAQHLAQSISSLPGFKQRFSGLHFNEFVIQCPDADRVHDYLFKKGVQGGLPLKNLYPELAQCLLFGVTELHTQDDISTLLRLLKEVT